MKIANLIISNTLNDWRCRVLLKKYHKRTIQLLIKENKKEILNDRKEIQRIEKKIETKYERGKSKFR